MPYRHHTVPLRKDAATNDHTASPTTFSSTTVAHDVYEPATQVNGLVDYSPQTIAFTTKTHHPQSVRQSHQQQQQRRHEHDNQQMQAIPMHKTHGMARPHMLHKQRHHIVGSAVTTLLPYCTAETPLNEEQVIAVTDVAGSLKELVLLALRAKDGDEDVLNRLEGALGNEHTVAGIVDFFSDEFEIQ